MQVNKAKEQALSREEALHTKILELEADKSRQDNEMKLLHQSKHMVTLLCYVQIGWNSSMQLRLCWLWEILWLCLNLQAEKQFEVRLKDLQLSLDQSESNKQSVQNYVDFLKQFYTTVFDDRLQTAILGASYFPK